MKNHPWWMHVAHSASHQANHGSKGGAWVLVIIGLCFAPMGVGIPIAIYGFYRLMK